MDRELNMQDMLQDILARIVKMLLNACFIIVNAIVAYPIPCVNEYWADEYNS